MANPPGQRFRKCDLHTHTPASKCYKYKDHTAAELVAAALDKGLDAIAVTDHNSGAWVDEMKQAAAGTALTIFPGVEISTGENYHVVVLFNPSASRADVEGLLASLDFTPDQYGRSEVTCTRSVFEIFEKAHKRGGLVVLAHIDEIKGAFHHHVTREVNPETGKVKISVPKVCAYLFSHPDYDAVEVVGGRLPDGFSGNYGIHRIPAFYQSSDNADPEQPTKHSKCGYAQRYTWFSMDEVSLEGLRQCFADPEVRIRQMEAPAPQSSPHIVSIKFGPNGFLAYQAIDFHPGLNCIVGHKGTGKSLAIEALRFALNQASADVDLHKDHVSKLERKLGIFNTVDLEIKLQNGSIYRIESKYEGGGRATRTCRNVESGELYEGDLGQLFPVLAYSQTEVIKIAEDEQAQLRLADALINAMPFQIQIKEIHESLCENDRNVAAALQAREKLLEAQSERATLHERIVNIDKTLSSGLMAAMRSAESKAAAFAQQHDYLARLEAARKLFDAEISGLGVPVVPADLVAEGDLATGAASISAARGQVRLLLGQIGAQIAGAASEIDILQRTWQPSYDELRARYDEQLRGTDSARLEVERREAVAKRDTLDRTISRYQQQVNQQLPQLLFEREALLDRLESAYLGFYELRKTKFDQLTQASGGKVQLNLTHAGNRDEYARALSDLLKGGGANGVSTTHRQKIADQVAPRNLVASVIESKSDQLAEMAGITQEMASRVIQRLWNGDDFGEVLGLQHQYYPTDVPDIRFNKGGGNYAPINELSVGQKCTALLLIALCDGSMPVIIDQPEDALDIASVWDDVAKKLRQGKQARQFILTTHNSSLAVGSDSDAFYVLEPVGGERAKIAVKGAIDRKMVRDALIDNLEGGENPYRLKNQKYNVH
jgi:hypothetical protein